VAGGKKREERGTKERQVAVKYPGVAKRGSGKWGLEKAGGDAREGERTHITENQRQKMVHPDRGPLVER